MANLNVGENHKKIHKTFGMVILINWYFYFENMYAPINIWIVRKFLMKHY